MMPYYQDNMVTLLHGDVLSALAALPAGSAHAVVTSPPYWALRNYHSKTLEVWGGKPDCPHEWQTGQRPATKLGAGGNTNGTYAGGVQNLGKVYALSEAPAAGDVCALCGAWRGSLGLEPTIDMYVAHLVEVFRAVRRVLRDDGLLFLNLGDSYIGYKGDHYLVDTSSSNLQQDNHTPAAHSIGTPHTSGLKPLDLCNIPHRVAQALQADGWYWRQTWHWIKRSPMPESVSGTRWERCRVKVAEEDHTQRTEAEQLSGMRAHSVPAVRGAEWAVCPGCRRCTYANRPERNGWVLRRGSWRYTDAVEYVFLMAKAPGYTAFQEQIREEPSPGSLARYQRGSTYDGSKPYAMANPQAGSPSGRNPRNWAVLSSEPMDVSHYATYPTALVEPFIHAATSNKGVCPTCGAQWIPVVERKAMVIDRSGNRTASSVTMVEPPETTVLGYWPSCECPAAPPVAAVVLDPFVGSGSTCLAARTLGRRSIGIDLSSDYLDMAVQRLQDERKAQMEMQLV